jgi:hypothetical protein
MYKIVCLRDKDFWVVESIVEIIADEVQVIWLIRELPIAARRDISIRGKDICIRTSLHGIDINTGHLCSSASTYRSPTQDNSKESMLDRTYFTILELLCKLHTPITTTVSAIQHPAGVS